MTKVLVALTLLTATQIADSPSVASIEQSALDARLHIKTATLKLNVKSWLAPPGKEKMTNETVYSIWLDGNKLRGDATPSSGPKAHHRTTACENCEKDGWGILYFSQKSVAATCAPLAQMSALQMKDAINPRLAGYDAVPFRILRLSRLDKVINQTARTEPSMKREAYGGKECWVLRFAIKPPEYKTSVTVWVSPSEGSNVVRIEMSETSSSGAKTEWIVSSELALWPTGQVWYPKKIIFEELKKGVAVQRDVAEVVEAAFNQPIDPAIFTLAGVEMREGTYIQKPKDSESGFWRDNKIDTSKPSFADSTLSPPVAINPPQEGTNYWLMGVCVASALGAVAIIVLRRRKA